jgi:sigma-B regulation protein RsbU (phosphoserine phosphatase)
LIAIVPSEALASTYDYCLVALSVLIAMLASFAPLDLGGRVTASRGRVRSIWLIGGAAAMGMSIWSMHYIGMLAYRLPVRVVYHWPTVLLSLLAAVLASAVALFVVTSLVDRRFSAQSLELQQSEQRYRELVDSAKVILWRGSLDGSSFSYINQEAEDLLGYAIKDWTSKSAFWMGHLHAEDRALAESCCRTVAEGRGPERFEHRMIAADGRVVWLRTSMHLVSGHGEAEELAGVMTDITDRKLAEEAAEEASRAKSGLLTEINGLYEQQKVLIDWVAKTNKATKIENARMSSELEITQRLQQMMLPRDEDMQKVVGLDISGSMEPATEIGGDYYDVVCEDGGVVIGIGDVTGHGLESGVIAIMVQTAVRTLVASGEYESRKFFEALNRVIYDNVRRMHCDRNLTLSLLHYRDEVVTISGQHEEVLVVRGNGVLERHDTLNLGFPLGLEEDISSFIGEAKVPLRSGDVMVAYTDGITEAVNCAGVAFGIERLSDAVRTSHRQSAVAIREAVLSSLRKYIDGQHLLDDVSLLVIKPA